MSNTCWNFYLKEWCNIYCRDLRWNVIETTHMGPMNVLKIKWENVFGLVSYEICLYVIQFEMLYYNKELGLRKYDEDTISNILHKTLWPKMWLYQNVS